MCYAITASMMRDPSRPAMHHAIMVSMMCYVTHAHHHSPIFFTPGYTIHRLFTSFVQVHTHAVRSTTYTSMLYTLQSQACIGMAGIQQGGTPTSPRGISPTMVHHTIILGFSFSVGTAQLQADICIGRFISCLSVPTHTLWFAPYSAGPTPEHTIPPPPPHLAGYTIHQQPGDKTTPTTPAVHQQNGTSKLCAISLYFRQVLLSHIPGGTSYTSQEGDH